MHKACANQEQTPRRWRAIPQQCAPYPWYSETALPSLIFSDRCTKLAQRLMVCGSLTRRVVQVRGPSMREKLPCQGAAQSDRVEW